MTLLYFVGAYVIYHVHAENIEVMEECFRVRIKDIAIP